MAFSYAEVRARIRNNGNVEVTFYSVDKIGNSTYRSTIAVPRKEVRKLLTEEIKAGEKHHTAHRVSTFQEAKVMAELDQVE